VTRWPGQAKRIGLQDQAVRQTPSRFLALFLGFLLLLSRFGRGLREDAWDIADETPAG